jgi:hypothetical protein
MAISGLKALERRLQALERRMLPTKGLDVRVTIHFVKPGDASQPRSWVEPDGTKVIRIAPHGLSNK